MRERCEEERAGRKSGRLMEGVAMTTFVLVGGV